MAKRSFQQTRAALQPCVWDGIGLSNRECTQPEGTEDEFYHSQLDRVRMRFWRRDAWHASPFSFAESSSQFGVQRYREAGDGNGRDHVRACLGPAGGLGQGCLRGTTCGTDTDVRQPRCARPSPGQLWSGDKGSARSAPRDCCPGPTVWVKRGCRRFAFDAQFCRRWPFTRR